MELQRPPISIEEKRAALSRVLLSRALGRSEQLRAFLRYVCEADIEGRAGELNEYVLGVSVLGRPAEYSPGEDSCVRSRAYELRAKLRIYYDSEAPDDPVRIEIDKGGYAPRFFRPESAAREQTVEPSPAPGLTPELHALWEPFLASAAPLLIAFDLRLFFHAPATGLVVRDYRTNRGDEVAHSEPLRLFRERMAAADLHETWDYADFGTVHAAFLLGRLLGSRRIDVGMKHSASLDWQDVWNSNVVFIGKPDLNPIIRSFLAEKDFIDELGSIRNLHPQPGEMSQYVSAATHGSGVKYAVITRVPGPQPGRHLLLLNGAGSELMWALAESVTNPALVSEMLGPLRLPSGKYAESFQVVIQAAFQANVPMKIRCLAQHVLAAP